MKKIPDSKNSYTNSHSHRGLDDYFCIDRSDARGSLLGYD